MLVVSCMTTDQKVERAAIKLRDDGFNALRKSVLSFAIQLDKDEQQQGEAP